MTPEVSKLLEQTLSLSVEEQEALADSLISNPGGKVHDDVHAALGSRDWGARCRVEFRQSQDDFMGGSQQAQSSKAAQCPLTWRSFRRRP
jgi:hypothetical protein